MAVPHIAPIAAPAIHAPAGLDMAKLTLDLGVLQKEIDKAAVSARKALDVEFQRLALSAILAVKQHGNVHYVNATFNALPAGARTKAMRQWFLTFGGVVENADKSKAKDMPFAYGSKDAVRLEDGHKHHWTTFAPEKPVMPLDVRAQLAKILATVDAGKREVLASEEAIEALRGLVADMPDVSLRAGALEALEAAA